MLQPSRRILYSEFSVLALAFPGFFFASPPFRPISASRFRSILAKPFAVLTFPPRRPRATSAGFFFFGIFVRAARHRKLNQQLNAGSRRNFRADVRLRDTLICRP